MEDDNELELSLGRAFGGSLGKLKGPAIASDSKVEEGSTNQAIGRAMAVSDVPFENLLQNNIGMPDQSGKQALSPPQENFWTDISKFSEESEAEVSSSWLVLQTVDTSKRTDLHKLTSEHALNNPTGIGFQGQKQQKNLSASCDFVEVAFGTSSPLQTHTPSMVAHAVSPKPTAVGACTPTSSPLPCMVQSTLPSNGDPSVSQGTDFDAEKLVFGYLLIQLLTLETNYSWAFGSQLQAVSSLGHGTSNQHLTEDDAKRLNGHILFTKFPFS